MSNPLPTESFDTRLETILVEFFNEAEKDVHGDNYNNGSVITKAGTNAKQAIKELVLSEIGEDEYFNGHFETVSVPVRNELRAELRARINGGKA